MSPRYGICAACNRHRRLEPRSWLCRSCKPPDPLTDEQQAAKERRVAQEKLARAVRRNRRPLEGSH